MRPKPVVVAIPPRVVEEAREYERRVKAMPHQQFPSYTGLWGDGFYTTGYICEWAFDHYLTDRFVPHQWISKEPGRFHEPDFLIETDRAVITVDVKGSARKRVRDLLVPAPQWERHVRHYDYLVAAWHFPRREVVELLGTCSVPHFAEHSHEEVLKAPTRLLPIGQLRGLR